MGARGVYGPLFMGVLCVLIIFLARELTTDDLFSILILAWTE